LVRLFFIVLCIKINQMKNLFPKTKATPLKSLFVLLLTLFTQNIFAQVEEDRMYIHLSSALDFYPVSDMDSITFQNEGLNASDSMLIWKDNFLIAKYPILDVDSISFLYAPTIYTPLIKFCDGIPMIFDQRDQSIYKSVKIGNQCWLRENLRYLPMVYPPNIISISEERYYVYDYNGDSLLGALAHQNLQKFGVLYNFKSALSACPKGWRLPTNEEWDTLNNFLITQNFNYDSTPNGNKIAKALSGSSPQSIGGWWFNSSVAGSPGNTDYEWMRNLSGFSLLPGGLLTNSGFLNIHKEGGFWSNSHSISTSEDSRSIQFNYFGLNSELVNKYNGLSVRCIAQPVIIRTDSVSDFSCYIATLNATLIAGAEPILEKGFYWKKASSPDYTQIVIPDNNFSHNLSNLDSSTTYQYYAYVTTINETKFGDTLSFTTYNYPICPGMPTIIDSRDSSVYKTVWIGDQCWLKENLRYLPSVSDQTYSSTIPKYYVYNYIGTDIQAAKLTNEYLTYGVLYNRIAIMNGELSSNNIPSGVKGVCPIGWHLPSESEFNQLIFYVGGASIAGSNMKSTYLWNNNGNGNNSSFFTALPGGIKLNSNFYDIGDGAYFWSCTQWTVNQSRRYFYINQNTNINNLSYNDSYGLSIRCIRNELKLSIDSITQVTKNSAHIYATVHPGYDSVIFRGVYYKKLSETQWSMKTTNELYLDVVLDELSANTIYQVVSFCLDVAGLKTSDTILFTTLHASPIPKDPKLLKSYYNRAILKFDNLTGTLPITAQFYRYRNVDSVNWNIVSYSAISLTDTVYSLLPGNYYDVENVIISQTDTIYSSKLQFITSLHSPCPGYETILDTRDSNYYETVLINGTCWFRENLRYLPSVVPSTTYSSSIPYYFVYGYNGTNLTAAKNFISYQIYGTLYNNTAATNGPYSWSQSPSLLQGACPTGWYLPSASEWGGMINYLNTDGRYHVPNLPSENIAKSLISSSNQANGGLWQNSSVDGSPGNTDFSNKRNLSGLSVIPGGCISNSVLLGIEQAAFFWTSTSYYTSAYYIVDINYNSGAAYSYNRLFGDREAASIRCVKHLKPVVYILKANNITNSSMKLNGYFIKGIDSIVSQGFLWKPLNGSSWNTVLLSGDTIFYTLNNLDSATVYEYKTFAITATDSIFSSTLSTITHGLTHCPNLPTIIDVRDSSSYNTVKIGDQCWLKENLRYLPKVSSNSTISNTDTLYYVYGYNDTIVSNAKLTNNYIKYGVLFNKKSSTSKVCPNGWVVPFQSDWDTLKNYLIHNGYNYNYLTNNNRIAKSLAGSEPISNGGYWTNSTVNGTPGNNDSPLYRNKSQLSFLPGGYITNGTPMRIDSIARFWIYETYNAKTIGIHYNIDSLKNETIPSNDANYIRCIKYNPANFELLVNNLQPTSVKLTIKVYEGSNPIVYKNIIYRHVDSLNWKMMNGNATSFTMSNLVPNSNYICRAYYIYYTDTIWTPFQYFTTAPSPLTFSTISIDNISSSYATSRLIVSKGSLPILTRGIQYQKHNSNIWTTINGTNDTIDLQINNLFTNTFYRVRAFASDSTKVYYSNYVTFSTSWNAPCPNQPNFTDSRDGSVYETVQIGNQCWMRTNLRYLPIISPTTIHSSTSPHYYVQGYTGNLLSEALSSTNYQRYGTLYNWNAATNGAYDSLTTPSIIQGVCPTGWHLPSKIEYDTLIQYLSTNNYIINNTYSNFIMNSMISSYSLNYFGGLWTYYYMYGTPTSFEVLNKKNASGFSALPGGYTDNTQYTNINNGAYFWTSTPENTSSTNAYFFQIYYQNSMAGTSPFSKLAGVSVRCVKD